MMKINSAKTKIANILNWTHLSNEEKMEKIERVLLDVYNLGCSDGYAEAKMEDMNYEDT